MLKKNSKVSNRTLFTTQGIDFCHKPLDHHQFSLRNVNDKTKPFIEAFIFQVIVEYCSIQAKYCNRLICLAFSVEQI